MTTERTEIRLPDGRTMMIPNDRLHPWHTIKLETDCWRMAHPIDCDLWDCPFNDVTRNWTEPPAPYGTYRWGPSLEDWKVAP